jgi:hypothetical protein
MKRFAWPWLHFCWVFANVNSLEFVAKKRGSMDWKAKEVKPHMMKLHVLKEKKRMKFTSRWERFYQKKERKEITFSYSVKFNVWHHPYPHIICICTTFYSLTFPFLTHITISFSINHDYLPQKLSRIFLCFYNIQGVAWVPLKSEPP